MRPALATKPGHAHADQANGSEPGLGAGQQLGSDASNVPALVDGTVDDTVVSWEADELDEP